MHDTVLEIIESLFLFTLFVWLLYMMGQILAGLLGLWVVCIPLILLIRVLENR